MAEPILARGSERAVLDAVLHARRVGSAVIVPASSGLGEAGISGLDVPEDSLVAFTSGSTGVHRGILRSHASWTASLEPLTGLMGLQSGDRVCVLGSVRATMGLYGAIHAVHAVGEVILADEPRDRATVAHAVPAAALSLLASPPTGLRLVVVAGDRVPTQLRELAARRGIGLLEYYGATELSFVAHRPVDSRDQGPGLDPFPGVRVRIEDGVIWAQSAYLAQGYLLADGTGAVDGPGRWAGGWATVGDRGAWVEGRLVVGGRESAVTVAGHTVHLADVEAFIRDGVEALGGQGPTALEFAVTDRPHEVLGAILVGVISATDAEAQRIREVAAGLPAAARPRRWIRVERLPRTAAGKVDRQELRRLVQDA